MERHRIGEILLRHHLLTEAQLEEGLRASEQRGGTLGERLVELGHLTEDMILEAVSKQTGLRFVNLVEKPIEANVLKLLDLDVVRSKRVLPLHAEDRKLTLGMIDPTDRVAIAEVEFATRRDVQPLVMAASQFGRALEFFEEHGYGTSALVLEPTLGQRHKPDMDGLLRALVAYRGQDLHLSEGAVPGLRVDGELVRLKNVPPLTSKDLDTLVASITTDDQRTTFARDLELDFAHSEKGVGRFRVCIYRQKGSLALTARYIQSRIPSMLELRLPTFLKEAAMSRQGFILVTGPSGHGKTTTLACLVDLINHERRANVVSIEDPIEYVHRHRLSNVNQREVGMDTKSFAIALRAAFRQAPDVIVIGEMRDPESVSIALSASGTGHLVLASMHANNATSALTRVVESLPGTEQAEGRVRLADSLLVSLGQRLVRREGGHGRVLATERVSQSHRVSSAIREGRIHTLRGMMQSNLPELVSLDVSLAELVRTGQISRAEASRWADDRHYFEQLLTSPREAHD